MSAPPRRSRAVGDRSFPARQACATLCPVQAAWPTLKKGLDCLTRRLREGITPELYMRCYSNVYDVATEGPPRCKMMYRKLRNYLRAHVRTLHANLSKRTCDTILEAYLRTWTEFRVASCAIACIFRYLERFFIVGQMTNGPELVPVAKLAMDVWREELFQRLPQITRAAIDLVNRDREGEIVDLGLLRKLKESLVDMCPHPFSSFDAAYDMNHGPPMFDPMALFTARLETPLVEDSRRFYAVESDQFLQENSVADYLKKVARRMEEERIRCREFLHTTTEKRIIEALESALIVRHLPTIIVEFDAMLRDDRHEEMDLMYRFLSRIPRAVDEMATRFRAHVCNVGNREVAEQSADAQEHDMALKKSVGFIKTMMNLLRRFAKLVDTRFCSDVKFRKAMNDAFRAFLNQKVGSFTISELHVVFCDKVLRGGGEEGKLSETEWEETMDVAVRLFAHFNDKDLFYENYRRALAKRLLSRRANEEYERRMLSKLKIEYGALFTRALEGMLTDMDLSADLAKGLSTELSNMHATLGGMEFGIHVLNSLHWPISAPTNEINLPKELLQCVDAFSRIYLNNNANRKLIWVQSFGTATVAARLAMPLELVVSTYQVCVLLLFNDSPSLSFSDIHQSLRLPEDELKRCIQPLACGRYKFLTKTPPGREITNNDTFEVNMHFPEKKKKNVPRKIHVPASFARITQDEKAEARSCVDSDRRHHVDAAIVRTMKSRQRITHNDLLVEVSRQFLLFKVSPKMIKTRIEALMEREYMERDSEDPKVFVYIA